MDERKEVIKNLLDYGLFTLQTYKIDKSGRCRIQTEEPIVSIDFVDEDAHDYLLRFSVNGILTNGPARNIEFDTPFPMDLISDTDVIEIWIDDFSRKKRKPKICVMTIHLTDEDLDRLRSVTYAIGGWQLRYCPWALVYPTE